MQDQLENSCYKITQDNKQKRKSDSGPQKFPELLGWVTVDPVAGTVDIILPVVCVTLAKVL